MSRLARQSPCGNEGSRAAPARLAAAMMHLRIVSPTERTDDVLKVLECTPSVFNIIRLPAAARRPDGDVILADVAREDTSVVLSDLKLLNIHEDGSITLEEIDTALSRYADEAERRAPGAP